jgi:hypothetical protein
LINQTQTDATRGGTDMNQVGLDIDKLATGLLIAEKMPFLGKDAVIVPYPHLEQGSTKVNHFSLFVFRDSDIQEIRGTIEQKRGRGLSA